MYQIREALARARGDAVGGEIQGLAYARARGWHGYREHDLHHAGTIRETLRAWRTTTVGS